MKLQVLVATMNQSDFSLAEKMNIKCDAIIANQTDKNEFEFKEYDFGKVCMISTATRGVGLNRNIALLASSADILLFADDDMCYYDGNLYGVIKAFEENPDADVIIFNVDFLKNGKIYDKTLCENKRGHLWNLMKFGTYAIAARRSSVLKSNIKFNELFGGGCIYSSGEDSLFIKSCLDNKLKIYTNSYVLGTCCTDVSSWFKGYNKKYFYDKGAFIYHFYKKYSWLFVYYFAVRFRGLTDVKFSDRIKLMRSGIKGAKTCTAYQGDK